MRADKERVMSHHLGPYLHIPLDTPARAAVIPVFDIAHLDSKYSSCVHNPPRDLSSLLQAYRVRKLEVDDDEWERAS